MSRRYELTEVDRQKAQKARSTRAAERTHAEKRARERYSKWVRRDAELWRALQAALEIGEPREIERCRASWKAHHKTMPPAGERGKR